MHSSGQSSSDVQSEREIMLSLEKDLLSALKRKKISGEAKIVLEEMLQICKQYREITFAH